MHWYLYLCGKRKAEIYKEVVVLALSQTDDTYPEILKKIIGQYYNSCYCFLLQERSQLIAICNHEQFHIQPTNLKQEFMNASHCENLWCGISISSSSYKELHNLYTNAVQRIFYTRYLGESSILSEISLFTYRDCVRIFQENEEAMALKLVQEYLIKITAAFDSTNALEMIYRSFVHNILLYLENNRIYVSNDQISMNCHVAAGDGLYHGTDCE